MIHEINSQKNRIEKFLQSTGFRLSSFASDIFGASGMNIIYHLISFGSIDREIFSFSKQIDLLTSIPGVALVAASSIIAEIGTDTSAFKTAEHICSWASLSPGNNESAGKRKSVAITKGNPYMKSMLCEVAWVIAGKRNTYLSTWYWKLKQRKGAKKAIIGLARKLLVIIYTMLKTDTYYDESVFEKRRIATQQKKTGHYIHELEKQGYIVSKAE